MSMFPRSALGRITGRSFFPLHLGTWSGVTHSLPQADPSTSVARTMPQVVVRRPRGRDIGLAC